MKTIIIYGSTTGNVEASAKLISEGFKESKVVDIADFEIKNIVDYDIIILGTSTAGSGELQDEWEDKIDELDSVDLSNKTIAIFGTGDQYGYPNTFAGGLNYLYEKVSASNAKIVGLTSIEGYEFAKSESVRGDKFVGLVLDDENQPGKTDQRVKDWVVQIAGEMLI